MISVNQLTTNDKEGKAQTVKAKYVVVWATAGRYLKALVDTARRHSKSRSHLSNVRAASGIRQLVELAGSVMGVLAPIWIGMLKNPFTRLVQADFLGTKYSSEGCKLARSDQPARIACSRSP